ncbi:DUF2510 domain-containing protein [Streptomyces sp. AM 2-1-1]|uniref:DUF2510 domain-containing protein n=1 Tax=Streptomyces sp. AM 2-1-1 TaxID=3028709 RepID=UPI0023B8F8C9|nr:DUF2510 domain-containing protein [Streptomyces sp. AM 2-1-1]WEH38511.1 DUF2510 domain-containing protein [Streptomyces sp. AM 2-1-1]
MNQTSPPGWHPDPGYTGIGPAQERWWDGTQWTDQLRVAPAAVRSRRVRIGVGITVGLVVLAAVGGGAYALGHNDGKQSARPSVARSGGPQSGGGDGRPGAPGGSGGNGGSDGEDGGSGQNGGGDDGQGQAPESQIPTEDGYATDVASGISLPVPDGWTGESGAVGASLTTGEYACPGDADEKCVRGGVFSAPAAALENTEKTAEAAAKKDISANAEQSYGSDIYEGITSHQQLKSEAVTVAGQKGYLVRWKVVTKKGDDGYVESLAFPSPRNKDLLVVVRSGFDINDRAPELSLLDTITKGIKAASAGSGSGQTA